MSVSKMSAAFFLLLGLGGCATAPAEYNKIFDAEHSLKQNQSEFSEPLDAMSKLVTETLTLKGFSIESVDAKMGIVKSSRVITDKDDNEITHQVQLISNLTELPGRITSVTLAAHAQSTLRHQSTVWWHLLWVLPIIPIGHEYQTVLLNEGSITDPGFYADFFNSLRTVEAKYAAALKVAEERRVKEEREAAERAAKLKAEEARAAAARAEADRIAAAAVLEAKLIAEAKAAAEKAEAERIAADKAAADKAAADKAAADKAAADKAAADKAAADKATAYTAAAYTAAGEQTEAKRAAQSKMKDSTN